MTTFSATPSTIEHKWLLVDADGKVLGRLATEVARRLRGKHKPDYTPHMDTGDYIVVINAGKIRVTGDKAAVKLYYRHSGYTGSLKTRTFTEQMHRAPEKVIEHAVKGMLPKGPLGRSMFRKLRIYPGPEHKHAAQLPQRLEI